jgi:prevent-host-death family protein
MRDTYSLYEAKAKLSAIIKQVREGQSVVITLHGKPAAEIRPIEPARQTLDERRKEMLRRGEIVPARGPRRGFPVLAHRPGALKRFLDERD